jgi:hypothetical protein
MIDALKLFSIPKEMEDLISSDGTSEEISNKYRLTVKIFNFLRFL